MSLAKEALQDLDGKISGLIGIGYIFLSGIGNNPDFRRVSHYSSLSRYPYRVIVSIAIE